MHPLLIKLGPIPVHTYGFLIAIGFLCAIYTIRKLAAKSGLDVDRMLDFTFWCLIVGFIGARVLFIITRFDSFMNNPLDMFKVWEGGLVFFGGLLAVLPFAWWYIRRHKISYWKAADVLFPGLVIGHAFGRFGCLSAGCCYGKPTGTSFGIKFYSELVEKDLQGIPLHPTQLYEAGALIILFVGLLFVYKRRSFDGQVGLTYLVAYPIIRSVVEIFRGDLIRGFIIDEILSTSQFISILIFLGALGMLLFRLKQVTAAKSKALA